MVIADLVAVTVFDLADYFLLQTLRGRVETGFVNAVSVWERTFPREIGADKLFEVLRDVYTRENSPASKAFRTPLSNALHRIRIQHGIDATGLIALIDEIPAVGADLLKLSLWHNEYPRGHSRCHFCQVPIVEPRDFQARATGGSPSTISDVSD